MQQYSSNIINQPLLSSKPNEKTINENFSTKSEIIQRSQSPTPLRSLNRIPQKLEIQPTKPSHTLTLGDNSVLSLVCSYKYLFSGSQDPYIRVWDLSAFQQIKTLRGHTGGILCLYLSGDYTMLFSSSGDETVRVWNTETLNCLYVIQSSHDVGDLFSVVYSDSLETLYIGCQNTSIQQFDLSTKENYRSLNFPLPLKSSSETEDAETAKVCAEISYIPKYDDDNDIPRYEIDETMVYWNSHNGYVYALLLGNNKDGEILISGSGDGDVKIWSIEKNSMNLLQILKGTDAGVLTFALHEDLLFCGTQGGDIKIYDLETYQHIRTLVAHEDDVLTLVISDHNLYSGSADGTIKKWSKTFEILDTFKDHTGIILSLTLSPKELSSHSRWLISGANDQLIKFWSLPVLFNDQESMDTSTADVMLYALSKWVSLRTVSGNVKNFEECLRGAKFLKSIFEQLGAEAFLLPGAPGQNPLVFGKFLGIKDNKLATATRKVQKTFNILVYGHYDVVNAEEEGWLSNPFEMFGKDGYLYGRGVTDNKGPMLAAIFAASELQQEKGLEVNVSFLIEGEEENGSEGFYNVVDNSKELIGEADVIFISNSYWYCDEIPCLNYGLRGVIRATIEISSSKSDVHSGMEGGAVSEPLNDMIRVLAKLVSNDNHIQIPGFYDKVRPITEYEEKLYEPIVGLCARRTQDKNPKDLKNLLMSRWRHPSLTIHKIDVSGPNNVTVIPRFAKATVSMRIVPDQDLEEIASNFMQYVELVFNELKTDNAITITLNNLADWWLGDPENRFFKATEEAVKQEWGIKPLYVREGGSIPAVRWLEKKFNAVAVNLPMGQASDQAHLINERIRLQNLYNGKNIFKNLFKKLSENTAAT
ncbi:WD40-repeat-containing domain protein [Gigaspora rosea]|uniref:WD40-repeat-containing domain protein n=1 Tax=Gigaspora rosea TaxID=44941 RepID=A0A397W145_9GLOM|nr:WD40-repeat-containing domain protein [Gigaspora rosea]